MTSQLSQPSSSISARDMGSTGAVPKRSAQYFRRVNRVCSTKRGDTTWNPLADVVDERGPAPVPDAAPVPDMETVRSPSPDSGLPMAGPA